MTVKELIATLQQLEAAVGANGPGASKDVVLITPYGNFYLASAELNVPKTTVLIKSGGQSAYGGRQ